MPVCFIKRYEKGRSQRMNTAYICKKAIAQLLNDYLCHNGTRRFDESDKILLKIIFTFVLLHDAVGLSEKDIRQGKVQINSGCI